MENQNQDDKIREDPEAHNGKPNNNENDRDSESALPNSSEEKQEDANSHEPDPNEETNCNVKTLFEKIENKKQDANIIYNINYITNNGIQVGDYASVSDNMFTAAVPVNPKRPAEANGSVSQDVFLNDETKLRDWLHEHNGDYLFCILVAVAVFEKRSFTFVFEIANELYDSSFAEDDKQKSDLPRSKYGELFGLIFYDDYVINETGKVRTRFVRFSSNSHSELVLGALYKEFDRTRDVISKWLERMILSDRLAKVSSAITSLSRVCGYDSAYFMSTVKNDLMRYNEYSTDFAVAIIMSSLSSSTEYCENVKKQIIHWGKIKNNHHYPITALMTCVHSGCDAFVIESIFSSVFTVMLEETKKGDDGYISYIREFYASGARKAGYFRGLIKALSSKINDEQKLSSKRLSLEFVAMIFTLFVTCDYSRFNDTFKTPDDFKDMIFIRLTLNKNISNDLVGLWTIALKNYECRQMLKLILENYLNFFEYFDENTLRVTSEFFRLLIESTTMVDLRLFLRNLATRIKKPNSLAKAILSRLKEMK